MMEKDILTSKSMGEGRKGFDTTHLSTSAFEYRLWTVFSPFVDLHYMAIRKHTPGQALHSRCCVGVFVLLRICASRHERIVGPSLAPIEVTVGKSHSGHVIDVGFVQKVYMVRIRLDFELRL